VTEIIVRRDKLQPQNPQDAQSIRRTVLAHYLTCRIGPQPQGSEDEEGETWCFICWQGDFAMRFHSNMTLREWMEAYLERLRTRNPAALVALARRGLVR
jgi:hypothetical protein